MSSKENVKRNRRFAAWRSKRPFAGGLLQLMAGIIILTPAYASFEVSNFIIQISAISGVSTLLIGALLCACGLSSWFKPDSRILTGVAGMILGIVALPMSNIGGFVVGTLCAVIGSALVLSWSEGLSSKQIKNGATSASTEQTAGEADGASAEGSSSGLSEGPSGGSDQGDSEGASGGASGRSADGASGGAGQGKAPSLRVIALLATLTLVTTLAVDGHNDPFAEAQINFPQLPGIPALPALPNLPEGQGAAVAPSLPALPNANDVLPTKVPKIKELLPQEPAHNAPIDLAPPAAIQGERPIQQGTYVIQTDSTALKGKVRMSLIEQNTPNGPAPALRIDADQAVLDNLRVQMPGVQGMQDMHLSSGPGEITTLTGNFHIVVQKITISPQIAGMPTFPITIDAGMAPEQITEQLAPMGIGLGQEVSSLMLMKDCYMDTYFVKSDYLEAPLSNKISEVAG